MYKKIKIKREFISKCKFYKNLKNYGISKFYAQPSGDAQNGS